MNVVTIASIALGVLILIGFLLGIWRSWKKSLIRLSLLIFSFVCAMLLSSKVSELLMDKYVDGLVISIFGQTIDIESIVGEVVGDLLTEGSALTIFATAVLNIFLRLIAFLILFASFMIVTLIIYFIIVAIMSGRQKSRSVGTLRTRGWERLIGGFVGVLGSLVVCLALFTPVFGIMNVCDKFLAQSNTENASAFTTSQICGKFYTESKEIGQVESYLQKYDKLRKEYKSSFAGFMLTYTGMDALGKTTFNKLSTVTYKGLTVNFTDECVNIGSVYNIYKKSFVENKFNLAEEESVDAIQKIYSIAKKSEVMKSVIVDIVPKMAGKWTNGEKFIGMELPVTGDAKELVVDLLSVFKSADFVVVDRNISVTLDAIRVANKYGVIRSINDGAEIVDVIDKGNFVEDEIKTLSVSSDMKRVLPNILTTTVKIAYKSVLEDPANKLDQEFSQEELAAIVWTDESRIAQTIVTNIFKLFDTEDVVESLDEFGVVIDSARESKILSKPVKILMTDYIDLKVTGLSDSVKTTILDAIEENWDSETYSYTSLFETVQTTAKVAENIGNMNFTDIPLDEMLETDADGKVKDTILQAVESGAIKDLVADEKKAEVYEDMITGILQKDDLNSENVKDDLKAGQVVADIINKSNDENSMFGEDKQTEADQAVEDITSSSAVMEILDAEAEKGESSTVKEYIDNMNESDKTAFENAIKAMEESSERDTLAKLFGVTFE